MTMIFKICVHDDWQNAVLHGAYTGSADDRRDGFIHFSTRQQVAETLVRHFTGRADLVIAAFDSDRIGKDLRWEPSRGGQLFPHLYGTLDPGAALWCRPLHIGTDGRHILPFDDEQ